MAADAGLQARVKGWLDDVGMSHVDGGVTGPALDWSVSMAFGTGTHVSLASDTNHPRRIEIVSDLAIADAHQAAYLRMSKTERAAVDRRLVRVIMEKTLLGHYLMRGKTGAVEKIAMRAHLPVEGLTPLDLTKAILEARNATISLCMVCQEVFGPPGSPLDRSLTGAGYASVLLQEDTLETLDAFQIPGETLDETILRAVRE